MKNKIGSSKSMKKYKMAGQVGPGDGIGSKIGNAAKSLMKAVAPGPITNAIPASVKAAGAKAASAISAGIKKAKLKKGGSVGRSKK